MFTRNTFRVIAAVLVILLSGSALSQGAPLRTNDHNLRLTPVTPSAERTAAIVAPGSGAHDYNVFYIDTRAFAEGGVLDIDIQIAPNSATDGSFDLFPAGVPIPTQGRPAGTLAGRYDIRRGSSTRLEYQFQVGQVFAFGLEGNWGAPRGATGFVQFRATVPGNRTQAKDACSLVGAGDVETMLGEPVRAPQTESHTSNAVQTSTCRFLASQSQGRSISVLVFQARPGGTTNVGMSDYLKGMHFQDVQVVYGVGVETAWGSISLMGKNLCQLSARKDQCNWISILIVGSLESTYTLNRTKTLAEQVLSRM